MEFQWSEFQISELHQDDPEKKTKWNDPGSTQTINTNEDKTLFPDDTGIGFGKPEDITPKLQLYGEITKKIF